MSQSAPTEDGRIARRLDNRARLLGALFTLIRKGNPHPTLRQIADQAGVTSRTLLNHFPDMGAFVLAATTRWRRVAHRHLPTVSDHPDPRTRVVEFFAGATWFLDAYSSVRWSTLTFPGRLPGFDQRQHKSVVLSSLAERVTELVATYGVDLNRDPHLRRAVLVMIDPLAWRLLRVQQGLSRKEAANVMAEGVFRLTSGSARPIKRRATRARPRAHGSLRNVVPIGSRVRLS